VPVICRTYQIMKLCLDKTSIMRSIAQTSVLERRCHVCGEPINDLNWGCLERAPSQSRPVETSRSAEEGIIISTLGLDDNDSCWRRPADFCRRACVGLFTERFTRMAIPPLNGHLESVAPVRLVVCATSASGLNCHLKWRYI
jgi:hypothetical protein